ncbi:MAG: DEAD/DEAH box helicase, partial [Planctomycetota bacterium]
MHSSDTTPASTEGDTTIPSLEGVAAPAVDDMPSPVATLPPCSDAEPGSAISDSAEPQVEKPCDESIPAETDPEMASAAATKTASQEQQAALTFAALGLEPALVAAVEGAGYVTPTPIQAQTIPQLLEGRDVLGQAQTGTGKTAAFALPLLQRIELSKKGPQVLVLTPTRELAIQVAEAFEKYASGKRMFRVAPIYGGQDYQIQLRQLKRSPQVVVGTPGRVMDHIRRGSLNLKDLQCLVLDEADEMLRMGFAEDVEWVLTRAPAKRQMALFSATVPGPIRQIAQNYLTDPATITIRQRTATADTVHQRYVITTPHQKQLALARILEVEPTDGVLVFVKMRSTTEPLSEFLSKAGLRTAALNGDMPQKQRERIVENLRSGKIDLIVATDVAARGLDVQRISHVINYDLPHDSEAYVHRIGRTGRAGRKGAAILFVHPRERRQLKRLEQATRHTIAPMELPSNRVTNKHRVAQFHQRMTEALASKDLETFQSVIEQYRRDHDVPLELLAAALAVLANGDTPLLVTDKVTPASFSSPSKHKPGGPRRGPQKKPDFKQDHGQRYRFERGMATYRIEVGRTHKIQPGNIVGAITNEAGIDNKAIGKIKIFDRFSTVDLPVNFPQELLDKLGKAR